MTIEFEGLQLFLLVLARMAGMVAFNPLLARRNVPTQVRTGFVLCLTILIAPNLTALPVMDTFSFVFGVFKELSIGFLCGYVFQIFYFMLFFVGDLLDTEFGMSMAKVFDPSTNIQMSISGNFLTIFMIVYVFVTDSHLILIQLFAQSYDLIPVAGVFLSPVIPKFAIELFISVFMFAFKLILPFAVAEFVLEASMGVLMKVIPQIHVFVINFQLKLIIGMTMLIICTPIIGSFLDHYIIVLFENMQRAITMMGALP